MKGELKFNRELYLITNLKLTINIIPFLNILSFKKPLFLALHKKRAKFQSCNPAY